MFKNHVRQTFLLLLKLTNVRTRTKINKSSRGFGTKDCMIFLLKERLQDIQKKDTPEHPHSAFYRYILQSTFSRLQLMKSVMARMLMGTDQAEPIPPSSIVTEPPVLSSCPSWKGLTILSP